jgi:hypothetical protein
LDNLVNYFHVDYDLVEKEKAQLFFLWMPCGESPVDKCHNSVDKQAVLGRGVKYYSILSLKPYLNDYFVFQEQHKGSMH